MRTIRPDSENAEGYFGRLARISYVGTNGYLIRRHVTDAISYGHASSLRVGSVWVCFAVGMLNIDNDTESSSTELEVWPGYYTSYGDIRFFGGTHIDRGWSNIIAAELLATWLVESETIQQIISPAIPITERLITPENEGIMNLKPWGIMTSSMLFPGLVRGV